MELTFFGYGPVGWRPTASRARGCIDKLFAAGRVDDRVRRGTEVLRCPRPAAGRHDGGRHGVDDRPLSALSRNETNEPIERAGGKAPGGVSARRLATGEKAGSKKALAASCR